MTALTLIIPVLLAYLLGSVSGSLLLGRLRKVDIRTMGSGNAGGTNAFRTQGFTFALGVVLIDIGKAVLATAWLPALAGAGDARLATLCCGFAAVVGHCFPAWHGFRGGKGAATAVGAMAVIQPWLLLPMIGTWVVVLVASGYVGLATVLAGLSLVPAALLGGEPADLLALCVALALFMVFTHRSNLQRLAQGRENRFNRVRVAWWLRRRD